MKSPYGLASSICAHFHWRLDYLLWGLPWGVVLRMLADSPRYESGGQEAEEEISPERGRDFLASLGTVE